MSTNPDVIIVSCYADLASARDDFDELTQHIKKQHFRVRESVLLGKNADSIPIVCDAASGHHGRTGAIVGAGMGFLIGALTMPVLPMTVAIGAATGTAVAKFADHTLKTGLKHDLAENLSAATGVVISVASSFDELWVRRCLANALDHVSVSYPESTIASLERVVTDAMGDMDQGS